MKNLLEISKAKKTIRRTIKEKINDDVSIALKNFEAKQNQTLPKKSIKEQKKTNIIFLILSFLVLIFFITFGLFFI
ncbi:hypothetical protein R4B61_07470 (plasmid) [Fructilactobacillus vespulae]|uniref:hypothetical protein n=1 Tax=Fructilactobacillus vespulae TaxID=1249630 RepID=UPI0039B6C850